MQVPYTNDKPHTVHIGGKMIRPGQTRDVDASLVQSAPPAEPTAPPDPYAHIREILGHKVGEISAMLKSLSDEDLAHVERLEGDAKNPRKGVLQAVNELQLERAKERGSDGAGDGSGDGSGDAHQDFQKFRAELQELPVSELDDLRALYAEDEDKYAAHLEAIDAEKKHREEGAGGDDT